MSSLTAGEKRKYLRQIILPDIGLKGQEKIKNAKVAVVGAGGIGCPALLYLASSGVGTLGIIDSDTIQHSNLHRQILYGENDAGKKKTAVAEERLKSLHPSGNYIVHDLFLTAENAEHVIHQYDIVLDGSDNFATRYVVNDLCVKLNKPLVYASVLGYEGQLAVFSHRGSKNLRDIFPEPPDPADVPDCSENGVMPVVPGTVGLLAANECLKIILGFATMSNRYMVMDLLTSRYESVDF
jgi:molybdopterin/thiamine biosynthesis adenylyltransferase